MAYSQTFVEMKLAAIKACQADPDFRPAKRITKGELEREQARKEKAEARAKALLELKKQQTEINTRKELAKKAKESIAAKKIKRLEEDPDPINQGHIKKTASTRDRILPKRIGGPDLTGKIMVKVDSKTWIYVDPGADVQAAIDKIKYRHGLKDETNAYNHVPPKYQF